MPMISELHDEYLSLVPLAERLRKGLVEQLSQITINHSLALAVPIESRVKSWNSIKEKLERKTLHINTLSDVPDLIGLRLVFLFSRHLKSATKTTCETFSVVEQEDTAIRLGESQFGYQPLHYMIRIPDSWTQVPTFSGCERLKTEIQMRTIAQHTWAAASHYLQYKRENSVPFEVRRSINRVSALLETVDLEFERVLNERDIYVDAISMVSAEERLNVNGLKAVLDENLPSANRTDEEAYDELVAELNAAGIVNIKALMEMLEEHLTSTIKHDSDIVAGKHNDKYETDYDDDVSDRVARGVFFTHEGLVRHMLELTKRRFPKVVD